MTVSDFMSRGGDPYLIIGPDGEIRQVVDADGSLYLECPPTLEDAFPDAPHVVAHLRRPDRPPGRIPATVRRPDGTPCPATISIIRLSPDDALVLVQVLDATAIVGESHRVLEAAFHTAPIGMAVYDTDGHFIRANPALHELLGQPRGRLLGVRDQVLTHPDDRQSDIDAAWRILNGEMSTWQTEKRFLTPTGDIVWVIANMTFVRDGHGNPLAWLGQFTDITARKRTEAELERLSDLDPLTGLASRRKVMRRAQMLIDAAVDGVPGVLFMIDLEDFKAINDKDGHIAGDAMLVAVAHALEDVVGHRGAAVCLGRLGGDEFVLLWPDASLSEVMPVVPQIRQAVSVVSSGRVGASVGLASTLGHGSVASLLGSADAAMYADKQQRRRSGR